MTLIRAYPIKCSCGKSAKVRIYHSVNVGVSPKLLSKVENREINNYKCPRCGAENELTYQFLYADSNKKLWIWCYPEESRGDRDKIEKEILGDEANNFLQSVTQQKTLLVFGYDELFEKIKEVRE